jgi:glycolate oxidase FAD binding subunit
MTRIVLDALIDRIREAQSSRTALYIRGGGSKDFYGGPPQGAVLDVSGLRGIVSHEPTELVITARCGTPLAEVEEALAVHGQCLAFEPPHFNARSTIGGAVAAGLSGPSRATAGSVRDHLLGASLINGRGEHLAFGGQVMKNVAGYDVSRLLAGSLGILGVITDVSLKVMPVPPATATLRFEMDEATALDTLNRWAGKPLPLHASVWWEGTLALRLRGATAAVDAAVRSLGGELIDAEFARSFWRGVRDQTDDFFVIAKRAVAAGSGLWRLSVPQTAAPIALPGEQLIEWGGGQRWFSTAAPGDVVRDAARAAGGHATLFRRPPPTAGQAIGETILLTETFTRLEPPLDRIHRELKKAFDPAGIFNRGRLLPSL